MILGRLFRVQRRLSPLYCCTVKVRFFYFLHWSSLYLHLLEKYPFPNPQQLWPITPWQHLVSNTTTRFLPRAFLTNHSYGPLDPPLGTYGCPLISFEELYAYFPACLCIGSPVPFGIPSTLPPDFCTEAVCAPDMEFHSGACRSCNGSDKKINTGSYRCLPDHLFYRYLATALERVQLPNSHFGFFRPTSQLPHLNGTKWAGRLRGGFRALISFIAENFTFPLRSRVGEEFRIPLLYRVRVTGDSLDFWDSSMFSFPYLDDTIVEPPFTCVQCYHKRSCDVNFEANRECLPFLWKVGSIPKTRGTRALQAVEMQDLILSSHFSHRAAYS